MGLPAESAFVLGLLNNNVVSVAFVFQTNEKGENDLRTQDFLERNFIRTLEVTLIRPG